MVTNQEKEKIKEMARNGESINHIRDKLNLPKSTVYYHFKKEVGQNSMSFCENIYIGERIRPRV